MLNKISALKYPCKTKELAEILDTSVDYVRPFIEDLIESGIFEKKNGHEWFKHQLVQKCLEQSLEPIRKVEFN